MYSEGTWMYVCVERRFHAATILGWICLVPWRVELSSFFQRTALLWSFGRASVEESHTKKSCYSTSGGLPCDSYCLQLHSFVWIFKAHPSPL